MCIRDRDKVLITITGYNCATGELQFDAVAPEAVSYTHLDVYKRQRKSW